MMLIYFMFQKVIKETRPALSQHKLYYYINYALSWKYIKRRF
jgi:hypothetical protein